MVDAPLPIAPGEILAGKYRIESVLGRGGMGVVLAATHVSLEQLVAIKFLVEDRGADPEMRERFAREARAASKIRSEHVARVLDVGVMDSGVLYTVMEYLEGEDLATTLRRRGAFPVGEAVGYVLQACEALAEAHVAGIVHRDLKPANVFLARRADGSVAVKLLDFGISKVSVKGADTGAITSGTTTLGSPRYMPPEQIRSARDVDARGDLWSLGATLFELLTGQPAFQAATIPELCVRILEGPAPELESLIPDAPPGLSAVLHRCLAKPPAARFATVAELAAALGPFAPAECRVSVERVSRILSVAGAAGSHAASLAPSHPHLQQLQDATTMTTGQAASGGKARSFTPLMATTALVVLLGLAAGGLVASRKNETPRPSAVVDTPPPAQNGGNTVTAAATPASVDHGSAPAPAPGLTPAPPSRTSDARRPPRAPPRHLPRTAGALSASAVPRAQERPRPPPAIPPSTLAGTEGFGDRK